MTAVIASLAAAGSILVLAAADPDRAGHADVPVDLEGAL
jgi:hypothetical protein